MDVVYMVTDTINNLSYIGSKKHYNKESGYLGSPSCKKGHPKYEKQKQFKFTRDNYPEKINFKILESFEDLSVKMLRLKETKWQRKFNATNCENFINGIYANATGRSCRKVVVVNKESFEVIVFESITSCEESLNIKNVGTCLKGKRFSTKGYYAISEEEYNENKTDIKNYLLKKICNLEKLSKKNKKTNPKKYYIVLNLKLKIYRILSARERHSFLRETNWKYNEIMSFEKGEDYEQRVIAMINKYKHSSKSLLFNLDIEITKNNLEIKTNIKDFIEENKNFSQSEISNCLRGLKNSYKGYSFKIK